jgi:hypothetical protein
MECGPKCISNGCESKCCNAPTSDLGIKVTILPGEVKKIEKKGGVVIDGYLQPRAGERMCPFKNKDFLCSLHGTTSKPFGCIVSPFMITKNNLLMVRNRYKLLPCYDKEHGEPAYKVFSSSFVEIFGKKRTSNIIELLNITQRNLTTHIDDDVYNKLKGREAILK